MHDPNQRPTGDGVPLRRMLCDDAREAWVGTDQADPSAAGAGAASMPGMRCCSTDGCERPHFTRGLCARCYGSERRALAKMNVSPILAEARAVLSEQTATRARKVGLPHLAKAMDERAARIRNEARIRAEAEAEHRRAAEREREEDAKRNALAEVRAQKAATLEDRRQARLQREREAQRARDIEAARRRARVEMRESRADAEMRARAERREAAARAREVAAELARDRKKERDNERSEIQRAIRQANDERDLLSHESTARLLSMLRTPRFVYDASPETQASVVDALFAIPARLRRIAFGLSVERDPLAKLAESIASSGRQRAVELEDGSVQWLPTEIDHATLEVVAALYGFTKESIRQIEARALRKLKAMSSVQAMRVFLEPDHDVHSSANREAA